MQDFIFEDQNAFILESTERPGGSTTSMGKFVDKITREIWLGKSDMIAGPKEAKIL